MCEWGKFAAIPLLWRGILIYYCTEIWKNNSQRLLGESLDEVHHCLVADAPWLAGHINNVQLWL